MPKVIKKRPAKKKPVKEDEVKSAALQALYTLKARQKQIIIAAAAVIALVLVYIIFSLYSSSITEKAYSLEMEAYNVYTGAASDESMSEADRWNKALELYGKAIDIKATPTALYYRGNCYFKLGDYENAIQEYSTFIDRFRRKTGILPLVYQKLASSYFKTGQNDKALETLDKLANVENGIFRDTALVLEARYYDSIGESEKALATYRELITAFPASPWGAEANAKVSSEEAKSATEKSDGADKTPEEPAPAVKMEKPGEEMR